MTDINTLVVNAATASFHKAPATGIHINDKPGTNPSPLLILQFQRYLNACTTSIPGETKLGMLLGLVINQATYESVNDNVLAFQAPPDRFFISPPSFYQF